MAAFSDQEKMIVADALNMYMQVIQQRMPEPEIKKFVQLADGIMQKMEEAGGKKAVAGRPAGISEEHFKKVCRECDKLGPDGTCSDPITKKFPGKCDPIIKYERGRLKK